MAERKPGLIDRIVERVKSFLWKNTTAVGETYFGLLLATGVPALVPSIAGAIFIYRGVDRFKKTWAI